MVRLVVFFMGFGVGDSMVAAGILLAARPFVDVVAETWLVGIEARAGGETPVRSDGTQERWPYELVALRIRCVIAARERLEFLPLSPDSSEWMRSAEEVRRLGN